MINVFVTCYNDENLIKSCLLPFVSVFDTVSVIDLGSIDNSLDIIKELKVNLFREARNPNTYHHMLNSYSKDCEWVFWADADEVYPIDSLIEAKYRIQYGGYFGYCIAYKHLYSQNNQLYTSQISLNGPKIFNPYIFKFHRGWPREYLLVKDTPPAYQTYCRGSLVSFADSKIWNWHGRMLNRSHVAEDTARRKKRICVKQPELTKIDPPFEADWGKLLDLH